jgi:hypothetical protein
VREVGEFRPSRVGAEGERKAEGGTRNPPSSDCFFPSLTPTPLTVKCFCIIDGRGSDTSPRARSLFFSKIFFQEKFCVYEKHLCRGIVSYHHHYTPPLSVYFIVNNNNSPFTFLTYQTPPPSSSFKVSTFSRVFAHWLQEARRRHAMETHAGDLNEHASFLQK